MGMMEGLKSYVAPVAALAMMAAPMQGANADAPAVNTKVETGVSLAYQVSEEVAVKVGGLFVEKIAADDHEETNFHAGRKTVASLGTDVQVVDRLQLNPHLDLHFEHEEVLPGGGLDVVIEAVRHHLFVVLKSKFTEQEVESSALLEVELPGHVSLGPVVLVESHYHGAEVLGGGEVAIVLDWGKANLKIALEGLGNGDNALGGLRLGFNFGEEGEVKPQMALEP